MKRIILSMILISITSLVAQIPSGETILEKVDQNMTARSRVFTSKMIIHGRRGSRTIESKSWTEGEKNAFTVYLAPPREKGTKMLKLGNKLWIYSPSADRTIQIAGHMLHQSVMGSDLSYEDMMEDPKLLYYYNASITGTDTVDERSCWVLELVAKAEGVTYHFRKMWIDQKRLIPLKEELFAKSGKLLKKMELKNITKIQGRWYARRIFFKDMLKKGRGTKFLIGDIQFNVNIPKYIFSKAALRR